MAVDGITGAAIRDSEDEGWRDSDTGREHRLPLRTSWLGSALANDRLCCITAVPLGAALGLHAVLRNPASVSMPHNCKRPTSLARRGAADLLSPGVSQLQPVMVSAPSTETASRTVRFSSTREARAETADRVAASAWADNFVATRGLTRTSSAA